MSSGWRSSPRIATSLLLGAARTLGPWFLALVLWLGGGGSRARAGNPDIGWRTLESEHFVLHYWAGQEDVARRVIHAGERAYQDLSVSLGHQTYLKVQVILTDDTDVANGFATAVPFPMITAFVTAPESMSVLQAYDDWLNVLITHELTHVIHLDTVHGIARAINAVFGFGVLGKVTAPNIVQPRWSVEGLASYHESDKTSQGRRRSAQFDMLLRMAVLEDDLQTIDRVSSGARVWPHGTSVYLYGLHLIHYIAARYGEDKLRAFSHVYATQLVPFGINRAIRQVLGLDFDELWAEFLRDTKRRFQAEERRIRARGLRQGRRLTFGGETTRHPIWSADDREILFYKDDGHRQAGIFAMARSGGRTREGRGFGRQGVDVDLRKVVEIENPAASTLVGASGHLIFDLVSSHDQRYDYSDLYLWDGGDPRKAEPLTFGARASEPWLSPDGRTVAFRKNDAAQSRLAFLDLASREVREVPATGRLDQVFGPRFSPDGRWVVYSGWKEGGYRDLYLYERASGVSRRLTADRFLDLSPTFTPDGKFIVFSSDRDGVFNLHAFEIATERVYQVSNVLGGAFEPAVSQDGKSIAYVGYSARGYDLWVMPLVREDWIEAVPSVTPLPITRDYARSPKGAVLPRGRYIPGRTFYPRTLFPTALDVQSSQFGTGLGLTSQVTDVVGLHSLVGSFSYLAAYQEPTGSVSYTLRRLFPTLSVGFGRGFAVRNAYTRYLYDHDRLSTALRGPSSYLTQGYRERSTRFEVDARVPLLRHPRRSITANVGYRFTRYTNLEGRGGLIDPNAPIATLPEVGDVAQVDLGLSYDGEENVTFGNYAEQGTSVFVNLGVLDKALGGDFGDIQATGAISQKLPMPWPGHQVLALRLAMGGSAGGLQRRGAFTVGGLAEDQDIVMRMLTRIPTGTAGVLRGYRPAAFDGRYFGVFNAEYRIPIADVERGLGTLPFFLSRVLLIPFLDVGQAWRQQVRLRDLAVGAGGSLVFRFRLGYLDAIDLMLAYAHGFDEPAGLDVFHASVARPF